MPDKRTENLIRVKTALADKYDNLKTITRSEPKRKQFKNKAERYRRQAEQIQRGEI